MRAARSVNGRPPLLRRNCSHMLNQKMWYVKTCEHMFALFRVSLMETSNLSQSGQILSDSSISLNLIGCIVDF